MCLIFGKDDIKSLFRVNWITRFMPAILAYAKKSGKKKVSSKLANLDETGEESTELISKLCVIIMWHSYCTEKCLFWYLPADVTSRQVVALRVLGECLGKGEQSLCYLYEEYMVSVGVFNAFMARFIFTWYHT